KYRVIQQHITTRYIYFKFYNSSASSWDQCCLYILVDQITSFNVDSIENLTNHMKGRNKVWTSISDIQSNGLTSFSSDRIFTYHRTSVSVKDHIIRLFCHRFFHIKWLKSPIASFSFGIEVSLHDIVLLIHRW